MFSLNAVPDLSLISAAVSVFPQLHGFGEQNYMHRLCVLASGISDEVSIGLLLLRGKKWDEH